MRVKNWTKGEWLAHGPYVDFGIEYAADVGPANAQLISAAPELVEALEGMLDPDMSMREAICIAERALAKAYGEKV